jgi:hypothetical protein
MIPTYTELVKFQSRSKGMTELTVLSEWDQYYPHFNGEGGHRFQGIARDYICNSASRIKVCVYCLRPERYQRNSWRRNYDR